jgi:hypothetical protein
MALELPMTQAEAAALQTRIMREQAATMRAQRELCELNLETARALSEMQLEEQRAKLNASRAVCERELLELEHRIASNRADADEAAEVREWRAQNRARSSLEDALETLREQMEHAAQLVEPLTSSGNLSRG